MSRQSILPGRHELRGRYVTQLIVERSTMGLYLVEVMEPGWTERHVERLERTHQTENTTLPR